MFTKHTVLAALFIAAMALAFPRPSNAQLIELYNDNGSSQWYFGQINNGMIWQARVHPCYSQFEVDSVKFMVYNYMSAPRTLTYKIRLYEDSGTLNAPNCSPPSTCPHSTTPVWSSPVNLVTPSIPAGQEIWVTADVTNYTFNGDFIVGIEVVQTSNIPSLLEDTQTNIACCRNFYRYNGTWREHYSMWGGPANIGYNMIRALGYNHGTAGPAELQLSDYDIWFAHVDISYGAGTEIAYDSLGFTNVGCQNDTITSITCPNADFTYTFTPPWVIAWRETRWLYLQFTTSDTGLSEADLTITHTGQNTAMTTETCHLSGRGFDGHWLENFTPIPEPLPGPGDGQWWEIQYSCTTSSSNPGWQLYGDWGWANGGALHMPVIAAACTSRDMLFTGPIDNPGTNGGTGVRVRWANYNYWGEDYGYHGFYWTSPNDTLFHLISEIPPTEDGSWTEVGPYYVVTDSDSVQLGWYHVGVVVGANPSAWWGFDDVRVDSLPEQPPILTHEHHTDDGPATWPAANSIHVTVQAMDPNGNMSYVTVYYKDLAGGSWTPVVMTAVPGCASMNLYEATISGLAVCHAYGYYFEADDAAASGPSYLPANAPTGYYSVDILDNTQPQIAYDDGVAYLSTYFYAWWARYAVRFTPPSYPYYLGGAMVRLASNWPDDAHQDIVVEVYNDDATSNMPGTFLCSAITDVGTSWNPPYPGVGDCDDTTFGAWVYAKIYPCVEITDGDFYIAARNLDNAVDPNLEAPQWDQAPSGSAYPAYRTYIGYPEDGGTVSWTIDTMVSQYGPHGDLMLRSIECACVPTAPTNATVYYYGTGTPDSVVIRWTHAGDNLSYNIYRSRTNPFGPDTLLGTVTATVGVDSFIDPVGTNTKAFYRVRGSCDPAFMAPPAPPSQPTMMAIGPVRIEGGVGRTAAITVDQPWRTVEGQLEMGILPKTISKAALERSARITNREMNRASHPSWNLK